MSSCTGVTRNAPPWILSTKSCYSSNILYSHLFMVLPRSPFVGSLFLPGSAPISLLPYNSPCNRLYVLDSKLTTSQHQLSPITQPDISLRMAAQQDANYNSTLAARGSSHPGSGHHCMAPGCTNYYYKDSSVHYHRLPVNDKDRLKQWQSMTLLVSAADTL